MNLSIGRVVIIVALVVVGLAVLANGFLDQGSTAAAPSGSLTPSVSVSQSSSTTSPPASPLPSPQTEGVLIMSLNGTDVTGAGAAAQDLLVSDGYKAPKPAADAPVAGVKKTTVYYRDDDNAAQNQADATYIATTYFDGAQVKSLDTELDSIVPPSVTVVVVVGEDFANSLAA